MKYYNFSNRTLVALVALFVGIALVSTIAPTLPSFAHSQASERGLLPGTPINDTDYTIQASDYGTFIPVTSAGGNRVITLPEIPPAQGTIGFGREDNTSNAPVFVIENGGLLSGWERKILLAHGDWIHITSDATTYRISGQGSAVLYDDSGFHRTVVLSPTNVSYNPDLPDLIRGAEVKFEWEPGFSGNGQIVLPAPSRLGHVGSPNYRNGFRVWVRLGEVPPGGYVDLATEDGNIFLNRTKGRLRMTETGQVVLVDFNGGQYGIMTNYIPSTDPDLI